MDDKEVERLYARYEERLGASMTNIRLILKISPGLIADVKADPFDRHALSSATCELYHRYGMYLAPLTAMEHCQLGHEWPRIKSTKDGRGFNEPDEESDKTGGDKGGDIRPGG